MDLWAQEGPVQMRAATPAPVDALATPVPAEDSLQSDQDEMLLPSRVDSPNHEPEDWILALEGRPGPRAECDLELVAQEQVLDHKVVPLTDEGGQSREEDAPELKHPGMVAHRAGCSFALLESITVPIHPPVGASR